MCPAKTSRAHSSIRYRPVTLTYEEAAERKHGEWMPLLSLPKYLEVSPDHPIINAPYIKAPDSLIKNGGNGFHQSNGQSLGLTGKAIRTTRSQPQQVGPFASRLLHQQGTLKRYLYYHSRKILAVSNSINADSRIVLFNTKLFSY